MIVDGRTLAADTRIDVDLCVVGAGPAGIALARRLDRSGLSIALVESGGLEVTRESVDLSRGESVGQPYDLLEQTRARGFGGASLLWPMDTSGGDEGWVARPLDAIDFTQRPEIDGSGWPFDGAALQPFYRDAAEVCGLPSARFDVEAWESSSVGSAVAIDGLETRIIQRSGHTFARHLQPLRASSDVRLILHATVSGISVGPNGRTVERVRATVGEGRSIDISARRFVLAAGGIENARLLLLSDERWTAGLGNDHDLVGRSFMERLTGRGATFYPAADWADRLGLFRSFLSDGGRAQATLALSADTIRREGLRNAFFWVHARHGPETAEGIRSFGTLLRATNRRPRPDHLARHARNTIRDLDDVASTVLDRIGIRRLERSLRAMTFQSEQAPDPASRITLGTSRDANGQPRARLDWRPSAADRESIQRSERLLGEAIRASGAGRLVRPIGSEDPPIMFIGQSHHMGTTRMHPDPRHGVVDVDGRVHGIENLYVTGGSMFPTSGASNPTLTIVALALRLADHLASVPVAAVSAA